MSRFHNDDCTASNPGRLELDVDAFRALQAETRGLLNGWRWRRRAGSADFEARLAEHVTLGDTRAAVVMGTEPLVVAAYTDELDCVALLRFDPAVARARGLRLGEQLLTVNTYVPGRAIAPDLELGPRELGNYQNVYPVIADFVSADAERIAARKKEISDQEWARCKELGHTRLQLRPTPLRDGSPLHSHRAAAGF